MSVQTIRLLGDPILRTRCRKVTRTAWADLSDLVRDLKDTLEDFKKRRGFGRGIAAPQFGRPERVIYIDFEFTGPLINPEIIHRSRRTFQLWDDCFSFPDLLVRVRRHHAIEVAFSGVDGKRHRLKATGGLSELLQHEIDHIDGVLAIDRAIDLKHIVLRSELDRFTEGKKISL